MSKAYEIQNALRTLPEYITMDIIYGLLNNNILGLLLKTSLEILQNAVIMESSTRRIDDRAFIKMDKMKLIHYILNKTGGLKNISAYIKKSHSNFILVSKLQIDNIFNFNNGITHMYYVILKVNQDDDSVSCIEIKQYNGIFCRCYPINLEITKPDTKILLNSQLRTAILLDVTHTSKLQINFT